MRSDFLRQAFYREEDMISKIIISILLFSMAAGFSACTSVRSKPLKEIVFDDKNTTGEISITNEDLQQSSISNSADEKIEQSQTLSDKSELETRYDAYGNKIETRRFKNHTLVDIVVVRTATNKIKQIFVYGFGDVVSMPEDFASTALSASSDEIANSAGLKTTRPFKSDFTIIAPTPIPAGTPTQIRPVIQPTPQIQIEETEKPQIQSEETEKPVNETQIRQSDKD